MPYKKFEYNRTPVKLVAPVSTTVQELRAATEAEISQEIIDAFGNYAEPLSKRVRVIITIFLFAVMIGPVFVLVSEIIDLF